MEEHERGREAFQSDEEFKLHSLRHSAAHILAQAVRRLYPKASFAIGPAIEDGFYYDIALDTPIAEAELAAIQAEMKKISKENQPFIQAVGAARGAVAVGFRTNLDAVRARLTSSSWIDIRGCRVG